jgi:26S proteasome regulatory subunit N9
LPKDEVEMLVMKAMSLHLVRGIIDEVDEVAHINWILPRYLSTNHLSIMSDKLKGWESKMEDVIRTVENYS